MFENVACFSEYPLCIGLLSEIIL